MNHYAIKKNGVVRSGEDVRSSFAASMFLPNQRREAVVCPKPRRVSLLNATVNDPSMSLRRHLCYEADLSEKARSELLDIILAKGGNGYDVTETNYSKNNNTQLDPFFCGSPPSRVSNPLIHDARFLNEKFPPAPSPVSMSGSPLSPTSTAARKGGCVRANLGKNPSVRVEGFDCLDRDRSRNCRIPALA